MPNFSSLAGLEVPEKFMVVGGVGGVGFKWVLCLTQRSCFELLWVELSWVELRWVLTICKSKPLFFIHGIKVIKSMMMSLKMLFLLSIWPSYCTDTTMCVMCWPLPPILPSCWKALGQSVSCGLTDKFTLFSFKDFWAGFFTIIISLYVGIVDKPTWKFLKFIIIYSALIRMLSAREYFLQK